MLSNSICCVCFAAVIKSPLKVVHLAYLFMKQTTASEPLHIIDNA